MNKSTVLLLALLLTACASTEKARESWNGATYDDFVRTWGPPNATSKLADGADVYTWISETGPSYRTGPTVGFGIGGFGVGGGGRSGTSVGVGASVPVGEGSVTPPARCERTLTFRGGQLVNQSWIGPDEVCSVYTRAK